MALDLLGPASAPGSVTARPADDRTFGVTDTFFKDCSSPTLDDGTEFHAAWFNQVQAVLRSLARGNGQTGAAVDIVTQDNADDSVLLKAVQHVIQRNQPKWSLDSSGAANTITVALTPALAEYKAGLEILVKIANTNTGATVVNCNTLGNKAVKTITGADPLAGALPAGALAKLAFDGVNFQIISVLGPAAFSQPKALLSTGAVSSLSMGVYTAVGLTNVSSTDLAPAITGGNTFTLPAGTYMFVLNNSMRIIVNNNTEVAESMRLTKNGAAAGVDFEVTYLTAGQDLTVYHTIAAVMTVTGSDTIQVQGETGTTVSADFNLGQINAGTLYVVRVGP